MMTLTPFRLGRENIDRLRALGVDMNTSAAAAVRDLSVLAGVALRRAFVAAGGGGEGSFAGFVLGLAADGARARMIGDPDYPIHHYFLKPPIDFNAVQSAEWLVAMFADWLVACDLARHGVTGPVEDRDGVSLQRVPNGGIWKKRGISGWYVLRTSNQRLTPDGIVEVPYADE